MSPRWLTNGFAFRPCRDRSTTCASSAVPALGPAALAINNYTMTIINVPALVPYDIELDDNLGFGDAIAGGTTTVFTGTPRPCRSSPA